MIRLLALSRRTLALAALLALVAAPALATGEFKARGFTLPGGAVRIDDDRFRLPQNWEEAERWYRNVYPPVKFPRRILPSQSGTRAFNLANPRTNEEWESVNVYEVGKGEVRLFVLARPGYVPEPEPEKPVAKPAPKPAPKAVKPKAKPK